MAEFITKSADVLIQRAGSKETERGRVTGSPVVWLLVDQEKPIVRSFQLPFYPAVLYFRSWNQVMVGIHNMVLQNLDAMPS